MTKILYKAKEKPFKFGLYWAIIFLVLFGLATSLGLIQTEEKLPEKKAVENIIESRIIPEIPTKIVVDKINLDSPIVNPDSREIEVLNTALESGSVRYPGSGLVGGQNNVLLFGHSSHLPIVLNKNYKAFNDLEDLIVGDEISVFGDKTEFIYKVIKVSEADAEDFRVDFNTSRRLLTLSTCDNFGDLDDRFVVEAELIGTRTLRGSL